VLSLGTRPLGVHILKANMITRLKNTKNAFQESAPAIRKLRAFYDSMNIGCFEVRGVCPVFVPESEHNQFNDQ